MSLRDLARAYLDGERRRVAGQACPMSGRLAVSGPDKTAQPHISLRREPVRTPLAARTRIARPDCPSGSDKSGQPGQLDNPDTSRKPDDEDAKSSVERMLAKMEAENERRREWWRHAPEGWAEGKLELGSLLTGEPEIFHFRKRRFQS